MLTQLLLRELLDYDPITGIFRLRYSNSISGAVDRRGYRNIWIGSERFRAARLVWLYMTGEWPKNYIDHVNGNCSDDRWCNLREATASQNSANTKLLRLNNTSGVRGVSWNKEHGKWRAYVKVNGCSYHCGYFHSIEEAMAARDAKAVQLHGAFAKLNNLTLGDMT